jgi:PadR family transcriptional regulator
MTQSRRDASCAPILIVGRHGRRRSARAGDELPIRCLAVDSILESGIYSRAMGFAGAIREAKKGTAELVVLAFLDDAPRHGYELTQLIEERSGGALTFNFASLYATLYKLEERKWIKGRWVEKAGQRRRRYYRLTPDGRKVLAAQRTTWEAFAAAIVRVTGGANA